MSASTAAPVSTNSSSGMTIKGRLANYKPTELRADLTHLTEGDKKALVKLADVTDLLNNAYYKQIWSGAAKMRKELADNKDSSEEASDMHTLFELYRGPWDRSFENEVFVPGAPSKLPTANVYPEDMTTEEFDKWVETLDEEDRKKASGFYHVIKRKENSGSLYLEPYSKEYSEFLHSASKLMKEASKLVSDESFAKFLHSRGVSFLSNNYLDSEINWLNITHKSPLEGAIGPYETYEDELYSAKAFFESMIHVRDFKESEALDKFTSSLRMVEDSLPIPDKYRNPDLVPPPIVVVNQIYSGGDVAVPLTAAYNLPNDEEAIKRGGSKLTMIKNVQEGKFKSVLEPISKVVIDSGKLDQVTFNAFFTHVLLHEVTHSNGPHWVVGTSDTVRSHLQELHSTFEEAKADIAGLFAARILSEHGIIDDITMEEFYTTYLSSSFRSIRFGLAEAHGAGQSMQLNYLLEKGGFVYNEETEKFGVDMAKIDQAVSDLTTEIMLIQGDGDKARAQAFKDKYVAISPSVSKALDKLKKVPIDIAPIWRDIDELRAKY